MSAAVKRILLYPDEMLSIGKALHNAQEGIANPPAREVVCPSWEDLAIQVQCEAAFVATNHPRHCGLVIEWTDGKELALHFRLTAQHTNSAVLAAELQSWQSAAADTRTCIDSEKGPTS